MKLEKPGEGRLKFADKDHPQLPSAKIGILIVNLGTPDNTDYWSMRRYLSEFLSDQRVIDYPKWLWQPLLQLVILSKRPFSSGEAMGLPSAAPKVTRGRGAIHDPIFLVCDHQPLSS